ncbi:M28 family peptidase [Conexibacter sp. SYSU D00693]|uniref:M28 family peptidase n=1 Tax=Conexibacter sp. SYSU D00693 TaxID=2812560 RepID=UPI00196BB088|nr:M28 family peptidase [Conexibacter sp. SYSU D00693]
MHRLRWGRLVLLATTSLALPAPALAAAPDDLAYDAMRQCAQLGAKPPGSAANRTQALRIERAFRRAGLTTTTESFHVPRFEVEHTSLVADGAAIPAETFAYGGTGRVSGDLVDVGVGRPADYARKDVAGKVVMVRRDEAFHRTSQLAQVLAHDGAAMLYVSGAPDNLVQDGTVRFAQELPAPIPAVSVGAEDGKRLRPGATVTIDVAATREDVVARNVLGVRRGTVHPDKVVVVGAHYDSWHAGAIDNCTAVGSLLSIVDAVRDVPLAYTVVFAGWDAEELGLVGSYDWVARHRDRLGDVVLDVNLEMTAAEAGAAALRFGTSAPAMTSRVQQAAAANGYVASDLPAPVVRQISGGILPTDIQPFYSAGVQGFSTFTSTPYYHTSQDTPERVDRASLRRVSDYLRDALLALQTATPQELAVREVPKVEVSAPRQAPAGGEVGVDVRVTSPTGSPVTGAPVKVRVAQNDHWARLQGTATELGDGRYRFTVPAGTTDADVTRITATVDTPATIAEGYATVDQTQGGLLVTGARPCREQAVHVDVLRGGLRDVRASVSAGKVLVLAGRVLVVDTRAAGRHPVELRVTARTADGRAVAQARELRRCAQGG